MTPEEKKMVQILISRFDSFEKRFEDYIAGEAELWGKFYEEFKDIRRGIYGDERNMQPGIIQKISETEKKVIANEDRIFKLETKHYKVITWALAIGGAVNLIYITVKEFIFKK